MGLHAVLGGRHERMKKRMKKSNSSIRESDETSRQRRVAAQTSLSPEVVKCRQAFRGHTPG